ncbi:MAG: hypothetical protein JXQ71_04485 [Verrucomicrobia bacterium]|nr:hypothetical protein [Verrucomicrobiota bacterium]
MKKLPKQKRDRILLVILGTLTCVVALWYGIISFQKSSLQTIAKAITEQQIKVGNAQRLVSSANQIQTDLEVVNQRLKAIENEMASGDKYSWIIQTINQFLVRNHYRETHKVDIPQFSREQPVQVGMFVDFPYQAVSFTIRGTAYFHDFGKFLADFENTFPFLRVQNIDLDTSSGTASPQGRDPEKLAFKMEIVALVNPGR